jgi:uncharacterized protein YjbI with pentapeptide repeats
MSATTSLLARYAHGERLFRGLETDDLSVLILDGKSLRCADFSGAFIVGTFRGTDLSGTCFRDANVKTCDFSGADLTDADFRGAALDATTFAGAKLDGALFDGASLQGHCMVEGELPDW